MEESDIASSEMLYRWIANFLYSHRSIGPFNRHPFSLQSNGRIPAMQSQWHRQPTSWPVQYSQNTQFQLEDAIRCARAAQEQLANAQHNFARETEQLHTTIAALEHSGRAHRRQIDHLTTEIQSLRSLTQSLRIEKDSANERADRLATELKGIHDDHLRKLDALQSLVDDGKSEIESLRDTVQKNRKRDRRNKQFRVEAERAIEELSALVQILRTDHEYDELLIADLDHHCAQQEMVLSDFANTDFGESPTLDSVSVQQWIERHASCETELEHRTLELDLAEQRLEDQKTQLDHFQGQIRSLETSLRQYDADASVAVGEAQLKHTTELQQLHDAWESERADWESERARLRKELEDSAELADSHAVAGMTASPEDSAALKETIDLLTQTLQTKDKQLQDIQTQCQLQQEALVESNKRVEAAEEQIASLQSTLDHQSSGSPTRDKVVKPRYDSEGTQVEHEKALADWERRVDQLESELIRARYQSNEQSKQLQAQATQFLQQATSLKRARDLALQNSQSQAQRAAEVENQLSALRKNTSEQIDDYAERLEVAEQDIHRLTDLLDRSPSESQNDRRAA